LNLNSAITNSLTTGTVAGKSFVGELVGGSSKVLSSSNSSTARVYKNGELQTSDRPDVSDIIQQMHQDYEEKAGKPEELSFMRNLPNLIETYFSRNLADRFITHVNVVEGAVYVKDGANDMSLLSQGESLRVNFKEMASGDQKGAAVKEQAPNAEEPVATPPSSDQPTGRYGTLKNPDAQVFYKPAGGEWQPAKDGMVILPGDEVRTAPGSKVNIVLDDGKTGSAQLSGGSLFRITAADTDSKTGDKTTMLDLAVGKVLVHAEKLKGGSKFEVRTPQATTGVRGTTFEVEVKPKSSI
jgi:ferric-dicitrate binding protein FerR (iron transport regulator)